MAISGFNIKEEMRNVLLNGPQPFCTSYEMVEWIQELEPKVKKRTVEVSLSRDLIKTGFVVKARFKAFGPTKYARWLAIYVCAKRRTEVTGDILTNHYEDVKTIREGEGPTSTTMKKERKVAKTPKHKTKLPEEISAFDLGRKVIEYIAELKQSLKQKDEEFEGIMRNFTSREKELKDDVAQLNKKITEQNQELLSLRNRVKRIPAGEDRKHGTFKLSEVAHIK